MGAMPEEVAPILERLGEYKTTKYADNEYYEASYNGVDIVVAGSYVYGSDNYSQAIKSLQI